MDTEITVLDGHDEVRATGWGSLQEDLPPGLYAIQVERAGTREEQVRRHAAPTRVQLGEPKRFSAVPASDTKTSHEYYQAPALEWSNHATAPPLAAPGEATGSLFIFVRASSAEAITQPIDEIVLRILDYSGNELAVLDASTTTRDERVGWLAYHAAAPAGDYVLAYDPPAEASSLARWMAIGVFGDWQTQIFMTLAHGPSFASASVLMGHGFDPNDRIVQAVDSALTGLQNGTDLLLREDRELLLHGKFDNPMLGLVGAHTLLQAPELQLKTMKTVLGNLRWLLGRDTPDLCALRLMVARRLGDRVEVQPFERPPMIRAGLEAVLDAAVQMPELVPRGGLVAQVATWRLVDSPWSTWKPRPQLGSAAHEEPRLAPEWISGYVQDAALHAARKDQDVDLPGIASRASLPLESVAQAYEQVRASMRAGPTRTIAMERLVTHARREAAGLNLEREEIRRLFFEGGAGDRIRALGLMQGDPSIQDFDVALEGIRNSKSAFEQYHALKLARGMVPRLDEHQQRELITATMEQRAPGAHIRPGSDRSYLSRQLLAELGAAEKPSGA